MGNTKDFIVARGVLQKYTGSGGDVVLPEGLTGIGESAFKNCRGLTGLVIPEGVTSIGEDAFWGCENLKTVALPESLTHIEDGAFFRCCALESLHLPAGLTSIGKGAFRGCNALTSVLLPGGLTDISREIFHNCNNLASVVISEGTMHIGSFAFDGCSKLAKIVLPDSIVSIEKRAFSGTAYYKKPANWKGSALYIGNHLIKANFDTISGNYVIKDGTKSIADGAFLDDDRWFRATQRRLTGMAIPDGVVSIGNEAFLDCNHLMTLSIPGSVTRIGNRAFSGCSSLTSLVIPNSVAQLGNGTFSGCSSLADITIPDGLTEIGADTFGGCKSLTSIAIPAGVTDIGAGAFWDCSSLTSMVIPIHVASIGDYAFSGCSGLREFVITDPRCKTGNNLFGETLPAQLLPTAEKYHRNLSDTALKKYLLPAEAWQQIDPATQAEIFLSRQGKTLLPAYKKCIRDSEAFGKLLLESLPGAPSAKECTALANFMLLFGQELSLCLLQSLYRQLKAANPAEKAILALQADGLLMQKLHRPCVPLPAAEEKMNQILEGLHLSGHAPALHLKQKFALSLSDIPEVMGRDGTPASPMVIAFLLAMEELLPPDTVALIGSRPEAAGILAELDPESWQNCLATLARKYLSGTSRSRKVYLAQPICRYANEALMEELTKEASSWRSDRAGKDALPLRVFRSANLFSPTHASAVFADRMGDLQEYARLRKTAKDAYRDQFLLTAGLDPQGEKRYDLGNQKVLVKLQADFSFLVALPDGKTGKRLPQKGVDAQKYAEAREDFSRLRKNSQEIIQNRLQYLFQDFLSGRSRSAQDWAASYTRNPLLGVVAGLLVWSQNGHTFALKDGALIDSNAQPYAMEDSPILLAHPMEMEAAEVAAWRKYFTDHGLAQPFLQIDEPVIDFSKVKKYRYSRLRLPAHRFREQETHGIFLDYVNCDDHWSLDVRLTDCSLSTTSENAVANHTLELQGDIILGEFSCCKASRAANHVIGLLDKWVICEQILKDDASFTWKLSQFTRTQIVEFLALARENHRTECIAALERYKGITFRTFDLVHGFSWGG